MFQAGEIPGFDDYWDTVILPGARATLPVGGAPQSGNLFSGFGTSVSNAGWVLGQDASPRSLSESPWADNVLGSLGAPNGQGGANEGFGIGKRAPGSTVKINGGECSFDDGDFLQRSRRVIYGDKAVCYCEVAKGLTGLERWQCLRENNNLTERASDAVLSPIASIFQQGAFVLVGLVILAIVLVMVLRNST